MDCPGKRQFSTLIEGTPIQDKNMKTRIAGLLILGLMLIAGCVAC